MGKRDIRRNKFIQSLNPNKEWKLWDANAQQKRVARIIGVFCLCMCLLALLSPIMGIFDFVTIMAFFVLVVVSAIVLVAYMFIVTIKNEKR